MQQSCEVCKALSALPFVSLKMRTIFQEIVRALILEEDTLALLPPALSQIKSRDEGP